MDSKEAVLNALKNSSEPLRLGDIAVATGIDKKEVDKAMKQLKKEDRITSPKRCYWEPK